MELQEAVGVVAPEVLVVCVLIQYLEYGVLVDITAALSYIVVRSVTCSHVCLLSLFCFGMFLLLCLTQIHIILVLNKK